MKILLVDDCRMDLRLASCIIDQLGDHEVIKVKCKREVLSALVSTPDIDLIVTDYHMVNETGMDVVNMVTQLKYDIPVVLLTASRLSELPSCIDKSSFSGIFQKTAEVDTLWTKILKRLAT